MGRTLSLFGPSFLLDVQKSLLSIGLKWVPLPISTRFSPTDNELLEHLKEKTDQTNSMPYPFIDAFISMSMIKRISLALSFLVLRCVLKLFLSVC
jgi:hypothetical protein